MTLDGRLLSNVSVLAAVVEGGNFATAADALALTPSGVSRAIARLEAPFGVRLLDRTTRPMSLTDAGRSLYANINALVLGVAQIKALYVSNALKIEWSNGAEPPQRS
jgi:DNA-binding transcriptional LysR family regulator